MKFSCDRCGQRYSSADEPEPGHSYRVPCLACGGTVLLKGGEFPALPTFAADAAAAQGQARTEAAAEEPVVLALAPMAQQDPPAASPRQQYSLKAPPRREVRIRWGRLAAAGGIAVATVGAGVLLFSGEPPLEPSGEARAPRGTSETMALLDGRRPGPDSASSATARAGPSLAIPPENRTGQAAVVLPALSPGSPGGEAALAPSKLEAASTAAARPMVVAGPKPAPSASIQVPARPRPPAMPAAPPGGTAPIAVEEPRTKGTRPTPEDVTATVAARRPDFDACLKEALRKDPGLLEGGLKVVVVVTVHPLGIVTSPQLDEPLLEDTALGECLRNVARRLLFPTFEGEPFQARIPLLLGR